MANVHADIDFEKTDAQVGPIVWFLAGLSVCTLIAMAGLWWLQDQFLGRERVVKRPERPVNPAMISRPGAERLPPEPRIEGHGGDKASHSVTNYDLATSARNLRREEDNRLRDGWVDAAGKKHPPIDEAIKMLIETARKELRR
jgi:hypothetical protein